MIEMTFGKCEACGKDISQLEFYHCEKCGVTKCSGCVKVTIIDDGTSVKQILCSEKTDSENLCGGSMGYMHTNIHLEGDKIVFDSND